MAKYFAPDLPPEEAALLAATQAPVFGGAFDGKITSAAFTRKPTGSSLPTTTRSSRQPLQLAFAEKMGATTIHVASSHVPMLSQPQAVADAVFAAVDGTR